MRRENTVDTTSSEILVSDARHYLEGALRALEAEDMAGVAFGLDHAREKLEELEEQLEEAGA